MRLIGCILIMVALLCLNPKASAQECGTEFLHDISGNSITTESGSAARKSSSTGPYIIPIVFHVFHLGEPVGIGSNISNKFVQEAIDRLNDNLSGVNGNGLDMEVRFCLATRNPEGHSTDGINRIDGTRIPGYAAHGARFGNSNGAGLKTLKDHSKWPVQDYYNVWVMHRIGEGNILGLASYPTGDDLDGTVIRYSSLATDVLTHEIGHGFNLFHTFQGDSGDNCPENSNCSTQGDEVCDTPPHRRSDCHDTNCNSNQDLDNSTSNFMSYCVGRNSFTQGQKTRFHDALFGPIRSSLLNSSGCSFIIDYNIALIEVINHENQFCGGRYFPKIRVRNQGAVTLNSFIVKYRVGAQTEQTQVLLTNLAFGEYGVFDLNPINIPDGFVSFAASLHSPNTFEDEQRHDNSLTTGIPFNPVDFIKPDIQQPFEDLNHQLPDAWSKQTNLSVVSKWNTIQNVNNGWLYVNGNFTEPTGTIEDDLTMPAIDLNNASNINLSFDYAFGGNSQVDFSQTSFEVLIKQGCNGLIKSIWKEQGEDLITFNAGSLNNPLSYKKISLDLDDYIDESVFISFRYSYNVTGSPSLNLDNVILTADTNTAPTGSDTAANNDDTQSTANLPDLTLSNLDSYKTEIEAGEILNFYFDVNNVGNTDVFGSYAISSYLSTDKTLSNSDFALERSFTGFTKVGTIPNLLGRIELPSLIKGAFYLILKVDGDDRILESNEINNIIVSQQAINIGTAFPTSDACDETINGFDFIGNYNNAAYYLSQNKTHWTNASFQATQQNGYLLSINDQAENNFIRNNINEIILIGLNDQYSEGNLRWHSGEPVTYQNFEFENSPSNDFARMNFWDGKWGMDSRWTARKYVIEIPCNANNLQDNIQLRQGPNSSQSSSLSLYPNPTLDILNIDLVNKHYQSNDVKFEVINTAGKYVHRSKKQLITGANHFKIMTSDLSSGVYQLIIDLGDGDRMVERFVKM